MEATTTTGTCRDHQGQCGDYRIVDVLRIPGDFVDETLDSLGDAPDPLAVAMVVAVRNGHSWGGVSAEEWKSRVLARLQEEIAAAEEWRADVARGLDNCCDRGRVRPPHSTYGVYNGTWGWGEEPTPFG